MSLLRCDDRERRDDRNYSSSSSRPPKSVRWSLIILSLIFIFPLVAYIRTLMTDTTAPDHISRESKNLIMIGVTGAGKSTLGNTLLARKAFEVGDNLDSCTSQIDQQKGTLFGYELGINIAVSDTGGLGDTEGRDDQFADDIAHHIRSIGGVHGILFVYNACNARLDSQARKTIANMVQTLTNQDNKKDLDTRLGIVMTQCTSFDKRILYNTALPSTMCKKNQLCNIPIFWFDDFKINFLRKVMRLLVKPIDKFWGQSSWRDQFTMWATNLTTPLTVPSETDREKLKKEHRENILRQEMEQKEMERRLQEIDDLLKKEKEEMEEKTRIKKQEIDDFKKNEMHSIDELLKEKDDIKQKMKKSSDKSCFSGSSLVHDRELGEVPMRNLKIGSEVKTNDGWAKVKTFLHWHPNASVPALQIAHNLGNLTLTPDHLLFSVDFQGSIKPTPAKNVIPGSVLLSKNKHSIVHSVHKTTMKGYFAPLTSTGTIIVDNVVASCYTEIDHYIVPHWVVNFVMSPLRFMPQWLSHSPAMGKIHPYAQFLMRF